MGQSQNRKSNEKGEGEKDCDKQLVPTCVNGEGGKQKKAETERDGGERGRPIKSCDAANSTHFGSGP